MGCDGQDKKASRKVVTAMVTDEREIAIFLTATRIVLLFAPLTINFQEDRQMNARQTHFLLALTIGVILAGLGCTNEKPQVETTRGGVVKEAAAAATEGMSYNVWTVTIKPGTAPNTCTADFPWQELYTNTSDPTENDQVRFKSSSAQAYTITFPITSPLTTQNGMPVPSVSVPANNANPNLAGPYLVAVQPDQLCHPSNDTCAYPYTISLNGGAQCNNGNSPPNGSDGLIVKSGQ